MPLAHESVYWLKMSSEVENILKQCARCLDYQNTQLQEETFPNKLPAEPWENTGADVFPIEDFNQIKNMHPSRSYSI